MRAFIRVHQQELQRVIQQQKQELHKKSIIFDVIYAKQELKLVPDLMNIFSTSYNSLSAPKTIRNIPKLNFFF